MAEKNYTFIDFKKPEKEGQLPFGAVIAYTTRDVVVRETNSGKLVAKTGLALNNVSRHLNYVLGTDFSDDQEVIFVELTAWEETARQLERVPKGSQICVTGFLGIEEYENRKGEQQRRLNLTISRFRVLRWKNQNQRPNQYQNTQPNDLDPDFVDLDDDDLPF